MERTMCDLDVCPKRIGHTLRGRVRGSQQEAKVETKGTVEVSLWAPLKRQGSCGAGEIAQL